MLKHACTAVLGYTLHYFTFDLNYPVGHSARDYLPEERDPYLLIGYAAFLLGLTIVGSLIIELLEFFMANRFHVHIFFERCLWLFVQIILWYFVACWSVYQWTSIGERYDGISSKMFAFGVAFACLTIFVDSLVGDNEP